MTSSVALNNAWSNANVLGLQSTTTIFPGGPLTDSQIGQLFALLMVGALFGNVTSLWIVEKYGRKPTIIATVLPQLVSGKGNSSDFWEKQWHRHDQIWLVLVNFSSETC